uniref:Uncharacterized protein n=1 Tax=Cannabis sativa TaxID=3483 RepID=A0A803QRK0_CANSA
AALLLWLRVFPHLAINSGRYHQLGTKRRFHSKLPTKAVKNFLKRDNLFKGAILPNIWRSNHALHGFGSRSRSARMESKCIAPAYMRTPIAGKHFKEFCHDIFLLEARSCSSFDNHECKNIERLTQDLFIFELVSAATGTMWSFSATLFPMIKISPEAQGREYYYLVFAWVRTQYYDAMESAHGPSASDWFVMSEVKIDFK